MTAQVAVIFDVDGVLIDSYHPHFKSWQLLAAEHNREFSETDFLAGFGRTSREVIAEYWDRNLSPDEIARLEQRKEALYRELVAENFPAMDGAIELIFSLQAAGIPLAVGSSGPPENVQLVLDKLGVTDLIDAQVTGVDVTRGKPDPQVFQRAAERLGMIAPRCAVVEDAAAGVKAAKAAGMTCIGLLSTGHQREELSGADLVVDSLRELSVERIQELVAAHG